MPAEPAPPDGSSPLTTAGLVAAGIALAWLGLRLSSRPAETLAAIDRVTGRLVPRRPRAPESPRALRVVAVEGWLLSLAGLLLAVIGAGLALARLL
ncbi:hypothetical protein [Anaeromyxobacter oryzae]|uniref:Uncharacterized protein n=1 Tax=Anaeromyxobacter oryzae TaxID=2918170 RepID=A0ABM7X0S6_9BACT|nr:hypothetical protein [Anaeromyxobacter oryzae]BDG05373.1 hypothetical protein AMOR_43690 [Anaeromyxobacter oryzae]